MLPSGNEERRNRRQKFLLSIVLTVFFAVLCDRYFYLSGVSEFQNLHEWLNEHKLTKYSEKFHDHGITSMKALVTLSTENLVEIVVAGTLDSQDRDNAIQTLVEAKEQFIKYQQYLTWLKSNNLEGWKLEFSRLGIHTLEDVVNKLDIFKTDEKYMSFYPVIIELEVHKDELDSYEVFHAYSLFWLLVRVIWFIVKVVFVSLVVVLCVFFMLIAYFFRQVRQSLNRPRTNTQQQTTTPLDRILRSLLTGLLSNRQSNGTTSAGTTHQPNDGNGPTADSDNPNSRGFGRIFGFWFSARKSKVKWPDVDFIVGNEVVLIVQFRRGNGMSYKASEIRTMKCEIFCQQSIVQHTVVPTNGKKDQIEIHFTPTIAAEYTISILAEGDLVADSPYKQIFLPGKIDPFKSSLVVPSCLLILQEGQREMITLDERDKFGNPCVSSLEGLLNYQFVICEFKESGRRISPPLSFDGDDTGNHDQRNKAWLTIADPGVYTADVFYNKEPLSENVILLVLSDSEMRDVNKNISTPQWSLYYEAYYYTDYVSERRKSLLLYEQDVELPSSFSKTSVHVRPSDDAKRKKVYCYISPKFLTVKEYYLKIFAKKQHTFRIKPSVKIHLHNDSNNEGNNDDIPHKCFTIESSKGDSLTLYCQQRNILVATFVKFMLKNIGGSEQFENKKTYFYKELFNIGSTKAMVKVTLKVQRETVVKDTMKFVKSFSRTDWWKHLYIVFQGELGMDYGGLSREWVRIILNELFHTEGGLFRRFNKDDQQALIHPNPYRIEEYQKLKFFEFAGQMIGKCLVECSCAETRQQYAKARFTRSFLSQLLGLGVSWKHFETDDKDYYKGKIKYILDNDPTDLDIYFSEDVYDNNDKFVKTVDLKPNGSQIAVTDDNKLEYLQRLAEYRLAESVKQEIASFSKGLNGIVEEGLLSIFDENEFELLVCGMETISVSDMKENCEVEKSFFGEDRVISWFWAVISGFSQEELTRLIQFITGCSQLPPSGFAGLSPKLQIKTRWESSSLPTSHTCFNMLVLPCYKTSDELKSKLLIAINEGSEGFGLA